MTQHHGAAPEAQVTRLGLPEANSTQSDAHTPRRPPGDVLTLLVLHWRSAARFTDPATGAGLRRAADDLQDLLHGRTPGTLAGMHLPPEADR
ncbi:hypothetical protein [Streptomyces chilikensis]|uniref:Uncharacterized protein n=1 Tax=Streptomyces chilikensis TaxID=1194079 RepID=A0ABV3EJ69_9ACTN